MRSSQILTTNITKESFYQSNNNIVEESIKTENKNAKAEYCNSNKERNKERHNISMIICNKYSYNFAENASQAVRYGEKQTQ